MRKMQVNLDSIINKYIEDYINKLFEYWKANPKIKDAINLIYFNNNQCIVDLLSKAEIINFSDYIHCQNIKLEFCSADDLIKLDFEKHSIISISEYEIFDFMTCDSIEDAINNMPFEYYLVKNKYYKLLDKKLMDIYNDYKKVNEIIYRKRLSDQVCFEFDFSNFRDNISDSIFAYSFPAIDIRCGKQGLLQKTDVRDFIFIPALSFTHFYFWSNNISFSKDGIISNISTKKGEPKLYQEAERYIISNSKENIYNWNLFISIIMSLQVFHFRIFEDWLIDSFRKESLLY